MTLINCYPPFVSVNIGILLWISRNDITTLAFYGHGSESILFFSMWQGKVIHFPVIVWFYKHFLLRYFAMKFDLLKGTATLIISMFYQKELCKP